MTNFSYNDGVPATNNNPSVDQPDMLINTQSIKNLINVDHLSFGVNDGGTHKQVTLNLSGVKPPVTGTQTALYTKSVSGTGQLFFEYASGTELQITGLASSIASSGYITLPGGLILMWGSVNFAGTGNYPVTFTPNFPTAVFSIVGLGQTNSSPTNNAFVITASVTTAGFTIKNSSNSLDKFNWMALGN